MVSARCTGGQAVVARVSCFSRGRIYDLYRDLHLSDTRLFWHYGDVTDGACLSSFIMEIAPDEIYNLAAQSHVRVSFDQPSFTVDVGALGTLRILEAARQLNRRKQVRFYQASSSEMFGRVVEVPQRETTPFHPRSPYACAKVFSFHQTVNYREAYWLFACKGILFNNEPPRRGESVGPLHGIPVGVKDIIDVAGMPTKCGSPLREDAPQAECDAAIVANLRAAGARIPRK